MATVGGAAPGDNADIIKNIAKYIKNDKLTIGKVFAWAINKYGDAKIAQNIINLVKHFMETEAADRRAPAGAAPAVPPINMRGVEVPISRPRIGGKQVPGALE
jgi:hypothetical protein